MSELEAKEVIISAKEYYDMRHELCEYHMLEQELGINLIASLKAFEVIKNKNVDIIAIKNLDNAWQYNTSERCRKPFIKILTDEEFYLLKEILI